MGKAKPKKKANSGKGNTRQEVQEVKPYRKLYVKIPTGMDMTEAKLTELFNECGNVISVDLVTTSNHVFGFVEFATVPEAERGIEKVNGHEDMVVKFAKPQFLDTPVVESTASVLAVDDLEGEDSDKDSDKDSDNDAEAPAQDTGKAFQNECALAAARRYPNPVESLQTLMQKSIGAASTADRIVYTVADVEDEWETLFVGTVQMKVPGGNTSHSGKPQGTKKDANKSAAEAALRDPEVHKLLPPLPPKVKEQQVETAADSEEVEQVEEKELEARTVLSSKKQKQLEKAELRAKKLAIKKAAKAAKAAVSESDESEDGTEEDEDEKISTNEDSEHSEESEESEEDDSGDDSEAAEAERARKAAIKAALAARRAAAPQRVRHTMPKEKLVDANKNRVKKKVAHEDVKISTAGQEASFQTNFGLTKFIKP